MTTTAEILAQLNAAVAGLANTRVEKMRDFHLGIYNLMLPVLQANSLTYAGYWHIYHRDDAGKVDLFTISLNMKDDKRARERRGRIISVTIKADVEGATIEEMRRNQRLAELRASVIRCDQGITKAKEDILKFETLEANYQAEIAVLEKTSA